MSLKQNIERLLILFCEDIKDYEYESSSGIGRDERSSEEFVKIFIENNPTQFKKILTLIQKEREERIEKAVKEIDFQICKIDKIINRGTEEDYESLLMYRRDGLTKIKTQLTGGK